MKNVLVVSDNAPLTRFFQEECARQNVQGAAQVALRYSAVNKSPGAMIELGATPADMKDPRFVRAARESFDLIFSIHCKQIFPAELVESTLCVNLHPGLNPHNRGWYPQVFSILNGKPSGATLHVMDAQVDHGGIIDQLPVPVRSSDTSLEVYERVLQAERVLLGRNLLPLLRGEFTAVAADQEGNYNSIQDFKSLCRLDRNAVGSLGEHIDLLRALSHGTFKNAFFIDEQGRKVFVRLALEAEHP